jgi:uncharacterized protein (DUF2252 family)
MSLATMRDGTCRPGTCVAREQPAMATDPDQAVDHRVGRNAGRRLHHLSRDELVKMGIDARTRLPRRQLAACQPAPDRPDPVAILEQQAQSRLPELVPLRHGRMLASPFAFYRGAAAVMAADLGAQPHTSLEVQLCGDAHLSNFGIFASPERTLVFDVNDFDETLPGPFEWDVKRLASSFVVAGRALGWKRSFAQRLVTYAVGTYRFRMAEYAGMGSLETWYSRIALEDLRAYLPKDRQVGIDLMARSAMRRDHLGALNKLTEVVDGRRRLIHRPPLMVRVDTADLEGRVRQIFRDYRQTLAPERRRLLARYRLVDLAHKVVGVGSVGTRCWIVYLEGVDESDPLFLQVKEAQASVLEPYLGRSVERHHGHRVVNGQRRMQAASDVFLGWITGPEGPHYYWRQLWDAKLSADIERFQDPGLLAYARACGWALARAHARSGNPISIAAYMGTSGRFEQSMLAFAEAYADQNEQDHAALTAAVQAGRLAAEEGV